VVAGAGRPLLLRPAFSPPRRKSGRGFLHGSSVHARAARSRVTYRV